jgi:hypothetical protein
MVRGEGIDVGEPGDGGGIGEFEEQVEEIFAPFLREGEGVAVQGDKAREEGAQIGGEWGERCGL